MKTLLQIPLFLFCSLAYSQYIPSDSLIPPQPKMSLSLSLLDLPYMQYANNINPNQIADLTSKGNQLNINSIFNNPSMEQSTQLSNNIRYLVYYGTGKIFKIKPSDKKFRKFWKPVLEGSINAIVDLGPFLPFGSGWQHEEFHRAAMSVNNVYSYNGIGKYELFAKKSDAKVRSVTNVLDTNLVLLKKYKNSDLCRIHSAGGEGQIYSSEEMQKYLFFHNASQMASATTLLRYLSVSYYITLCSNKQKATNLTKELSASVGPDPLSHDFTGLDFTAWAYDLYYPDKSYAERGINNFNTGYDRYIYGDKLPVEMYNWLQKQSLLSCLNFISPMNFYIRGINFKINNASSKFNFSFRYYPTSFGNQLGLSLFLASGKYNIILTPSLNQNYSHTFS